MTDKEYSMEIADFARDHCKKCVGVIAECCPSDSRVAKCLKSRYVVSTYKGQMYTRRNDYPIEDWRHYIFEETRTLDAVHNDLRKNT